jgi:hypothetical protein
MVLAVDFVVVEHLSGSFLLPHVGFFHILQLLLVGLDSSLELRDLARGNSPIADEVGVDWLRVGADVVLWQEGRGSGVGLLPVGLQIGVFDEHLRLRLHSNHYNGERYRRR